jgi:hypothetical protein
MTPFFVALCLLFPQPPAASAPNKAALVVQEQLVELSLLQSLTPLKLTPEQIGKLLPALKKARESAVELNKQDDEDLVRIGPEVAKARAQAIAGSGLPDTIEKRVLEMQRLAASRRLEATRKTVKAILEPLRELLTESQKSEIEKLSETFYGGKRVPKEYAKDPSKAPKDVVQELAISAYIERTLLFDKTIALLELMKAAPKPE